LLANKSSEKKELLFVMTAGCLLGILCFAMVYGFKILNPLYDEWIFNGDIDLRQHYVGFCHFRNTRWMFPIGLVDSLSVPYSMSIVYTDSIPLFALFFKLFRNLLPVHFQYFGLFGLMSFMLMGMLSTVLIRRFCKYKSVCIFGSLFFILSFPVLQRMFYHTALAAQWIIVLALIIWMYTDITDIKQLRKICIYWTMMGLLAVLIHSYFVFMTGIILLAQIIDGIVRSHNRGNRIKEEVYQFLPLLCMFVSSVIMLFALGGFYGAGSVSGDGFGSFDGNLTAFINPLQYGSVFKGFELYGMFEFEGFAYLGAGLLLASLVIIGYCIYRKYILVKTGESDINSGVEIRDSQTNPDDMCFSTKCILIIVSIVCYLFACFPNFTFGKVRLFSIPVPSFVKSILGICRTNGRFIWIPMYIIIICILWFIAKRYEKIWIKMLFAAIVIIQLYDISGLAKEYKRTYMSDYTYNSVWSELPEDVLEGKKQFVFMYDDSDIMMDTAFIAYLKGMEQNSFYYARTIYDEIDSEIARYSKEFLKGKIENDKVYIFRDSDYSEEYDGAAKKAGAGINHIDGHIVITK